MEQEGWNTQDADDSSTLVEQVIDGSILAEQKRNRKHRDPQGTTTVVIGHTTRTATEIYSTKEGAERSLSPAALQASYEILGNARNALIQGNRTSIRDNQAKATKGLPAQGDGIYSCKRHIRHHLIDGSFLAELTKSTGCRDLQGTTNAMIGHSSRTADEHYSRKGSS